ncbi:MAG: hypothetical protein Q7S35_13850 [Candidatus Limnocylindrales bacterium]|nr:hypothetical protein [Candidatus Limnocylindrales bacterium]
MLDDVREVIESYDAHGKVLESIPAFPDEVGPNDGANQLAVGPEGHLFVSVVFPNEVIELDRDGNLVTTYGGSGSHEGAFTEPPNIVAFDSAGRRYVTQGPGRGDHPPRRRQAGDRCRRSRRAPRRRPP